MQEAGWCMVMSWYIMRACTTPVLLLGTGLVSCSSKGNSTTLHCVCLVLLCIRGTHC